MALIEGLFGENCIFFSASSTVLLKKEKLWLPKKAAKKKKDRQKFNIIVTAHTKIQFGIFPAQFPGRHLRTKFQR